MVIFVTLWFDRPLRPVCRCIKKRGRPPAKTWAAGRGSRAAASRARSSSRSASVACASNACTSLVRDGEVVRAVVGSPEVRQGGPRNDVRGGCTSCGGRRRGVVARRQVVPAVVGWCAGRGRLCREHSAHVRLLVIAGGGRGGKVYAHGDRFPCAGVCVLGMIIRLDPGVARCPDRRQPSRATERPGSSTSQQPPGSPGAGASAGTDGGTEVISSAVRSTRWGRRHIDQCKVTAQSCRG